MDFEKGLRNVREEVEYKKVKNIRKIKKHKISFETALAFITSDHDPDIEYIEDHSDEELRYHETFRWNDKYLFIGYTMRGTETVRIISPRPAKCGTIIKE